MAAPHFRHRIERTRNKHSRALYRGNTIIIRLAKNLTKTEEKDHIQSLLRRMTQIVLEERSKVLIDPFRHLLNGGQSQTVELASGRRIHFELVPAPRTVAYRTRRGWRVGVGPGIRRKALQRFLWRLLSSLEQPRMEKLVLAINRETYRHRIRKVDLHFATTQWGSCSTSGRIMLNTALLFVPPSLLKYVIVHELAHRRFPDHSPSYWREVERGLPNYRRAYKLLQEYRLPSE